MIVWALASSLFDIVRKHVYHRADRAGVSMIALMALVDVFIVPVALVAHLLLGETARIDLSGYTLGSPLLWCLVVVSVLGYSGAIVDQYAYTHERISVLLPFGSLQTVLSVVFGFLLFRGDTSMLSLGLAIGAACVLFVANFDFRTYTMNRYTLMVCFTRVCYTAEELLIVYLLFSTNPLSIILVKSCILTLFGVIILTVRREWGVFARRDVMALYPYLLANTIIWMGGYMISLYIITEIGIVNKTLLGMLGITTTLALAYVCFRDRPSAKSLYLAIFTSAVICANQVFAGK